jgi:eukaryotic-like serine/threonine-protein kinase
MTTVTLDPLNNSDSESSDSEQLMLELLLAEDRGDEKTATVIRAKLNSIKNASNFFGIDESRTQTASESITRFKDYELIELVSETSMSRLYRGRQRSLPRDVAVKFLKTNDHQHDQTWRRMIDEANASATLEHPNIAPIYEVGSHDGQPYIVSRWIEGVTFRKAIENQTRRQIVQWIVDAASALHHIHQHGIIHRDLKPENLLIDTSSRLYVIDFGLVKYDPISSQSNHSNQRPGAVVGTLRYMAPEQALATSNVTTSADIYSLGVILYEAIAGIRPINANSRTDFIEALSLGSYTPLNALSRSIDQQLSSVVDRCLNQDPQSRYASADALASDLSRWLRLLPVRATRASFLQLLSLWTRRNPSTAIAAVVFLFAVVAMIWMLSDAWTKTSRSNQQAIQQREIAEASLYAGQLASADR